MASLRFVGRVRRTVGDQGLITLGDVAPNFLGFPPASRIQIGFSESFAKAYTVRACEPHKNRELLLLVDGINTASEAAKLLEQGVFASEQLVRDNSRGDYLEDDILGCVAYNVETREPLGTVTEVWYMPANDVWVVDFHGSELPIPAVEAFIKRVDVQHKEIDVFVMPGLLDLANSSDDVESGDTESDDMDNEDDEKPHHKGVA